MAALVVTQATDNTGLTVSSTAYNKIKTLRSIKTVLLYHRIFRRERGTYVLLDDLVYSIVWDICTCLGCYLTLLNAAE